MQAHSLIQMEEPKTHSDRREYETRFYEYLGDEQVSGDIHPSGLISKTQWHRRARPITRR